MAETRRHAMLAGWAGAMVVLGLCAAVAMADLLGADLLGAVLTQDQSAETAQ